jgi:hypothetical protein
MLQKHLSNGIEFGMGCRKVIRGMRTEKEDATATEVAPAWTGAIFLGVMLDFLHVMFHLAYIHISEDLHRHMKLP